MTMGVFPIVLLVALIVVLLEKRVAAITPKQKSSPVRLLGAFTQTARNEFTRATSIPHGIRVRYVV